MQISKCLLVVCAAVCTFSLPLRSQDTDAQTKAREALEKKMKELQGQSDKAVPSPAPAKQPEAKPQPAPAAPPPAAVSAPSAAPAVQPVDSEALAKAREAMRQKMNELQTQSTESIPQPQPVVPPP